VYRGVCELAFRLQGSELRVPGPSCACSGLLFGVVLFDVWCFVFTAMLMGDLDCKRALRRGEVAREAGRADEDARHIDLPGDDVPPIGSVAGLGSGFRVWGLGFWVSGWNIAVGLRVEFRGEGLGV
jgi:hypothetical protein